MGWLLLGLVAMVPVIFGLAHIYASYAQDQRATVIVQLTSRVEADLVIAEHTASWNVQVLQRWNTSTSKGYRALVSRRAMKRLEADVRVTRIDVAED